jgi:hypothetical protein
MDKIYDQWFKLKGKNEDYAAALRGVLSELDTLISNHGLDKKKAEVFIKLKEGFAAALNELDRIVQSHCESQPASPLRRDKLQPALTKTHQTYSLLYNFTDPDETAKQQYQTVLNLESYLTLIKEAYPGDGLENSDALVSALKSLVENEWWGTLFVSLPKHGRLLAINAITTIAAERGWPQNLYAAKSILAALSDQFSSASSGDMRTAWGGQAWQNKTNELTNKSLNTLNTSELQGIAERISSLAEWETQLLNLRQRLGWNEYGNDLDGWRKFIVGELSKSQSLAVEETYGDAGDSLQSDRGSEGEVVLHPSFTQAPLSGDSELRLPAVEEVEDHNSIISEETGQSYCQPDFIIAALHEAIEAKIEVVDWQPAIDKVKESLCSVQALLSQRIIHQFNQQLPQIAEELRVAADNLQSTSPQFEAITAWLSKAYAHLKLMPKALTETNALRVEFDAGRVALDNVQTAWDTYQRQLNLFKQHPDLGRREKWPEIQEEIKQYIELYASILQARDAVFGLRGAASTVNDLMQVSQIEVVLLYITLGLQAVRNFELSLAQKHLANIGAFVKDLPQDKNKHIYSLLEKLKEGVQWLQRVENERDILAEWRDAVYAEDAQKAKQSWEQLEALTNKESLLSGWVVTEVAERQMGIPRTIVIGHGSASLEENTVFDLFLQLFDLVEVKGNARDSFTLYGRAVKQTLHDQDILHLAPFTFDKQKIFLNASSKGLQKQANTAEKLKNHRLTYTQSEHLRAWLSWYNQHEKTRQIIKMVSEDLVSANPNQFVSKGQINTKPRQLIDHIENMSVLKKRESDLPLTQSTKDELEKAVSQIVGKLVTIPEEAKNAQGELKKWLLACQKFLINLPKDGTLSPQISAQPDMRPHSETQPTDLADGPHSVQGNPETPPIQPVIETELPESGVPATSDLPPSKTSIFRKFLNIWSGLSGLLAKKRNKKRRDSHE